LTTTEEKIYEMTSKNSIQNINDFVPNKSEINESIEIKIPEKKKKHKNQSTKDLTTTEEKIYEMTSKNSIQNINDFVPNKSEINESIEIKTPEKKKKHKNQNTKDLTTTEEKIYEMTSENSIQNINDFVPNKSEINESIEIKTPEKKKKHKNQSTKDLTTTEEKIDEMTSENSIRDINDFVLNKNEINESIEIKTPEKKKKHNNQSTKDLATTIEKIYGIKRQNSIGYINDCIFKKSKINENNESSQNDFCINKNFKIKTLQKKTHDKSINLKDNSIAEERAVSVTRKNSIGDINFSEINISNKSLDNNYSINNESIEMGTSKKKEGTQ